MRVQELNPHWLQCPKYLVNELYKCGRQVESGTMKVNRSDVTNASLEASVFGCDVKMIEFQQRLKMFNPIAFPVVHLKKDPPTQTNQLT